MKEKVKTPCCGGCKLEKGLCVFCFRTVKEIKDWMVYTDEKRDSVLEKVKKRKEHKKDIGELTED